MPTKARSGLTGSKKSAGGSGDKKPNGLQHPLQPSKQLAAVVGPGPLPRGEVVRKVWVRAAAARCGDPRARRRAPRAARQACSGCQSPVTCRAQRRSTGFAGGMRPLVAEQRRSLR